jgi:hypothetical protein
MALVCGLTFGDYLLWNWSLSNNHDVPALVSGLTLPPLAVACVWLMAVSLARVLSRSSRRASASASTAQAPRAREGVRRVAVRPRAESERGQQPHEHRPGKSADPASPSAPPPRKLAA